MRPDACDVLCFPISPLYSFNRIKTRELWPIRYAVGVVSIPPTQARLVSLSLHGYGKNVEVATPIPPEANVMLLRSPETMPKKRPALAIDV